MTVKELIMELEKLPEELEAVIVHVDWDLKKIEIDHKNRKAIFK